MIRSRSDGVVSHTSSATDLLPAVDMSADDISLEEILSGCSSQSVDCRKEGVTLLQWLVETREDFSQEELGTLWIIFKRMLAEQNSKVFSAFLDVLPLFLSQHGKESKDWLFIMVLRLLHKQSSDLPDTVASKIQCVLEQIRHIYSPSCQMSVLFQILLTKAQPMNTKTKQAWLQYFLAVATDLEPGDVTNKVEFSQVVSKIVSMVTETKTAELRKLAVKALTDLYQLNTSGLMRAVEELPRNLQNCADVVLKDYLERLDNNSGEDDDEDDEAFEPYPTDKSNPPTHHILQTKSKSLPRVSVSPTSAQGSPHSPRQESRKGHSLSEIDLSELYVEPHKSHFPTTANGLGSSAHTSRSGGSHNGHTPATPNNDSHTSHTGHTSTRPSSHSSSPRNVSGPPTPNCHSSSPPNRRTSAGNRDRSRSFHNGHTPATPNGQSSSPRNRQTSGKGRVRSRSCNNGHTSAASTSHPSSSENGNIVAATLTSRSNGSLNKHSSGETRGRSKSYRDERTSYVPTSRPRTKSNGSTSSGSLRKYVTTVPTNGSSDSHTSTTTSTDDVEAPNRRWSGSKVDMTKRQVVVSKSTHSFGDQNSPKSHIKTSVSFSATSDLYEYETTKSGRNGDSRTVPGGGVEPHQPSRKGGSRGTLDRLVQLTHPSSTTSSNGKPVDPFADAMKSLSVKGSSAELRLKALQTLLGLARNPTHCNWEEHSSRVLHKLMELMQDESGEVKVLALRVFREVVKVKPDILKNVTELVITKVLKSCQDKEMEEVFCEEVIPVLVQALGTFHVLPLLVQFSLSDSYPLFYLALKMLTAIIPLSDRELVSQHVESLLEAVKKHFIHSEGPVRMVTVYCVVALLQVLGDEMKHCLNSLSVTQSRLIEHYFRKSQEGSGQISSQRNSGSVDCNTGNGEALHNTGSVAMSKII